MDGRVGNSVLESIYWFYRTSVYPRVKFIRGTHWLMRNYRKLVFDGERIDGVGEKIGDRDWDNLIILDACRFDSYRDITGCEEYRYSSGSCTRDYVKVNFSSGDFDDVVYVHANGFLVDDYLKELTGREDIFHAKFDTILNRWDEEEGTVLPEAVCEDAMTAQKLFPEKRKIVHFIQPHMPFIGSDLGRHGTQLPGGEQTNTWTEVERGNLSHRKAKRAYEQNLDLVVGHALKLANKLEGKTVITADHGELIGENGQYGHPCGSDILELRKVPWHVVSN